MMQHREDPVKRITKRWRLLWLSSLLVATVVFVTLHYSSRPSIVRPLENAAQTFVDHQEWIANSLKWIDISTVSVGDQSAFGIIDPVDGMIPHIFETYGGVGIYALQGKGFSFEEVRLIIKWLDSISLASGGVDDPTIGAGPLVETFWAYEILRVVGGDLSGRDHDIEYASGASGIVWEDGVSIDEAVRLRWLYGILRLANDGRSVEYNDLVLRMRSYWDRIRTCDNADELQFDELYPAIMIGYLLGSEEDFDLGDPGRCVVRQYIEWVGANGGLPSTDFALLVEMVGRYSELEASREKLRAIWSNDRTMWPDENADPSHWARAMTINQVYDIHRIEMVLLGEMRPYFQGRVELTKLENGWMLLSSAEPDLWTTIDGQQFASYLGWTRLDIRGIEQFIVQRCQVGVIAGDDWSSWRVCSDWAQAVQIGQSSEAVRAAVADVSARALVRFVALRTDANVDDAASWLSMCSVSLCDVSLNVLDQVESNLRSILNSSMQELTIGQEARVIEALALTGRGSDIVRVLRGDVAKFWREDGFASRKGGVPDIVSTNFGLCVAGIVPDDVKSDWMTIEMFIERARSRYGFNNYTYDSDMRYGGHAIDFPTISTTMRALEVMNRCRVVKPTNDNVGLLPLLSR